MDRWDKDQLKRFRDLLLKEKTRAEKTVAEYSTGDKQLDLACKYMVARYSGNVAQCDAILELFDEIFEDYVYTGASAEELLAACKMVNLDCNDDCPIFKAYKGNVPMDEDECRCAYFEDGEAMLDYLKGDKR